MKALHDMIVNLSLSLSVPSLSLKQIKPAMANSLLSLFLFLISFPFLPIQTTFSSSTDSFVFGGCTQQKYAPYESNLNSLLTSWESRIRMWCSRSVGRRWSLRRRGRDAMMAGLMGGGGLFRVGGSGEVQAIQRLKSKCAATAYGDMYLGKCYARFSTAGDNGHYYPKSHNEKSGNDGEKTFAIIIRLLAGIALLIIFLAFLRKVVDRNGK
ncbi:hypothetical protein CXB51_016423 [Gossypium anomalum]|uniref:Gnk2-homologous domain-containing protein n=1 Tax=Gossypium anomalum TaxID=47600 RepID=A0A8J5Z4C4_9ROSI|nr:hypothetical protein CXB51_016423 [Gossypium anomalum]